LLIIDNDGTIHDVSANMTGDSPRREFAMRLGHAPGARAQPMLLLAIASPHRIASLSKDSTSTRQLDIFPTALTEAETQGPGIEVAVKYFKFE
jgi:hypothetical protein